MRFNTWLFIDFASFIHQLSSRFGSRTGLINEKTIIENN